MAWGVAVLSNLLGDSLAVMRLSNASGFVTNPICPIGLDPSELSSWVTMTWRFHAVAWRGDLTSGDVYDACLRFDDDPSPTGITDVLPVGMAYTTYKPKLTADALTLTLDATVDLLQ